MADKKYDTLQNPFPGLRPFQSDESHLFFGRDRYLDEILRKLNLYHFVSVVGNSGSGKSSLVRAGVLPRIAKEDKWILCTMRPGKSPLEELCNAVFSPEVFGSNNSNEQQQIIAENLKILSSNKLGLVQAIRTKLPAGKQLLILVDQFEEIFRFNNSNENDSTQLVDILLAAAQQNDVPIYVMLTLRSDFLGDCEQFVGLPEAINNGQFLIPRLKQDELQLCISGPIEYAGQRISPRLIQLLLKDVGSNPDQLPVMQHVLMRTWEVWIKENDTTMPIDVEHYQKTGKMEKGLSNHAEEAMLELVNEADKKIAENLFKTLTLKEGENRGIRRPTMIGVIAEICNVTPDDVIRICNVFRRADRGFIMPSAHIPLNGNSVIDISHESLMRVWQRLTNWVNEQAESVRIYKRITESAQLYEQGKSSLIQDPDLLIATDWLKNNKPNEAWALQYNENYQLCIRFIEASSKNKAFLLAAKKRTQRTFQIMIIVALFVLSGITVWAFFERQKSDASAQVAVIEKQKAEAQSKIAQENYLKAEAEKQNAEAQKKIAFSKEQEAQLQKLNADRSSVAANDARKLAEIDKQIAILQKQISDSLKVVSEVAEKNAYRLRILSIAQNLAIKSTQALKGTYPDNAIKPLLALQAFNFTNQYQKTNHKIKGKRFDVEIFNALFSSERFVNERSYYSHNYHNDEVLSACFSPDGKKIASAGADGELIICNADNLKNDPIRFTKQLLILSNLSYSSDGKKIVCLGDNKNILLFDTDKPLMKPTLLNSLNIERISAMNWFGKYIISASFDSKIKLIDMETGKIFQSFNIPSNPNCLSVCKEKNLLAIGCENGTIYLLDLKNGSEINTLKKMSSSKLTSIDFNYDGSLIACATENNVKIIKTSNPSDGELNLAGHKATVTRVSFEPNENILASTGLDATIRLWNINFPDDPAIIFTEHDSWIYDINFNFNGSKMLSCGKDKTVKTYTINENLLWKNIAAKLNRNLSQNEWMFHVGNDIDYEKTIKELN